MSTEYHPLPLPLRVHGWLFDRIWLVVQSFNRTVRYAIAVEDPVYGRFELTSNMVIEWKLSGRWYQTKPELLVDHVLSKGDPYETGRRDRNHDG